MNEPGLQSLVDQEDMGVTADTEAGQQARPLIQDRLESYDGVWGVEGDLEWPQFSEDETQAPATCPIHVTRLHPTATPASYRPASLIRRQ